MQDGFPTVNYYEAISVGMAGDAREMSNPVIEAESGNRVLFRNRETSWDRRVAAGVRPATRLGGPRLRAKIRAANGLAKRLVDIVIAATALILLSPAWLTIAVLIKASDGGPILYRHRRIGRFGARFDCLKFRTMATDGDARLARHLDACPDAANEWRDTQKLREDPRVTAVGGLLRRSSFDELPQLWNVLRGDMSIVGPRPVTRAELRRYGRDRRYYLLVRPGMTGLWQVSGRSRTTYQQRVGFDREYLEEWSWLGDVWIMLMTVPAILRTEEAC